MAKIEETLKPIINSLTKSDISFNLDDIFSNVSVCNCFLKNKELLKLLMRYLIILHNNDMINDLGNYYKDEIKDDGSVDEYFFLNGEYAKVDLKKIKENEVNEMLLFNTKKTLDSHFNTVFEMIKEYDIFNYNFPFDENYLNAKINSYKFNFLKKYYTQPEESTYKGMKKYHISSELKYDPKFGDAFILPYNFNNMVFKRSFYYLCAKHLMEIDMSVDKLLCGFLNFESLFYSKNVTQNNEETNLVTYIFFTGKNESTNAIESIPNLRYTLDIPGNTIEDKISYLKEYETQREKFDEFDTSVIFDEKGVYFSTNKYQPENIMKKINKYISSGMFDEMLYYIFNSQFLSRSTCLFGYWMYFIFTGKIPSTKKYYDIIALTSSFETFKNSLSFEMYTFKNKISQVTLSDLIDFVMKDN